MQSKSTRTTSQDEQEISQILRYNPLRFVREAYVRFIQGLFYAAPPGQYHWELDHGDTEIVICDENPIKTDVLGKRPGITCTRAPIAFYTLGLDDMLQYNPRTGVRKKTVLLPGTMSINCCSRVPLEAEQLAWIVAENIWLLRDVMRRWGFYDIGRNLAIGSPSPPGSIVQNDSGDEWYAVTITSPFQMNRVSQVYPLGSPIAEAVEMSLSGSLYGRRPQGVSYGAVGVHESLPHGGDDLPKIGGRECAPGEGSLMKHTNNVVPHPLDPSKTVTMRAVRPGDPIYRQPSIRGRTIPIAPNSVEESPIVQIDLERRIVKT
jgi:hypothetical protein